MTPTPALGRDARITKREYDDALDDMRQATIERCAQEIEGRYFKHINDAAAAIRTLKDKPSMPHDPDFSYSGKDYR